MTNRLNGLHQFYAVAERIGDIAAIIAVERLIFDCLKAGLGQTLDEGSQARDRERRMSLPSGAKFLFDTKMHSQRTAFEPATTPFR